MTALILLVIAGLLLALAVIGLRRLSQPRAGAVLILVAAGGLAVLRMFQLAIPLALVGYGLWRRGAPGPTPAAGQSSEVRSDGLEMTLDHDSGEMDGEVLAGSFAGAKLSDLSLTELRTLMAEFEASADTDSLSLLIAYLERRRDAEPEAPSPPPTAGPMTEAEAYRILGLAPGASVEEVREAYRRLILRVHPDLGGTTALAAMLNAAKDLLDPDAPGPH